MNVYALYTCDEVQFSTLMIHYLTHVLRNIALYFTVYNTTSSLHADCVSLLLHQTDRTELLKRLCCQSRVQWFVVTIKPFKPLHRHIINREGHPLKMIDTIVMVEQNVLFE